MTCIMTRGLNTMKGDFSRSQTSTPSLNWVRGRKSTKRFRASEEKFLHPREPVCRFIPRNFMMTWHRHQNHLVLVCQVLQTFPNHSKGLITLVYLHQNTYSCAYPILKLVQCWTARPFHKSSWEVDCHGNSAVIVWRDSRCLCEMYILWK